MAILFVFPVTGLYTQGLFLDGRWLMFAAGALVYYATNYATERREVWFGLPLVVLVLQAIAGPGQLQQGDNQAYLAAFLFALLLLALKRSDQAISRWRLLAPLRYCGDRCYSLYLVFWPVVMIAGQATDRWFGASLAVILLVRIPIGVALTVVFGSLFHRWVERRFWNPPTRGVWFEPPFTARVALGAEHV